MRVFNTIVFVSILFKGYAQQVPISPYTYENHTAIDNYFGETDSLLLLNNITVLKAFGKDTTEVLLRLEEYKDGKKVKVQEFHHPSGKPDRTIIYTYGKDVLEAELVHYLAPGSYYKMPSGRHGYLVRMSENATEREFLYNKDDTVTNVVRMRMRHTWRDDGTILFESFNKDGKLISTHVMTPVVSWDEYQSRKRIAFPAIIEDENEDYRYNSEGKLIYYKNKRLDRETIFTYDIRGLLIKRDVTSKGKSLWIETYKYE